MDKELFICYGKISPAMVQGYELVVLEAQHYTSKEIELFKTNNSKVLGYLSVTEVNMSATHYEKIREYTFGQNVNWGSCFIDISDKKAQDILLTIANELVSKGLDGFFLDNLDNASQWGRLKGQKDNLLKLIGRIRQANPSLCIVQNSGLFVANQLKHITDAVVIESVFTDYDFKNKKYGYKYEQERTKIVKELKAFRKSLKKPLIIVEYVDNEVMRKTIETQLKELGFGYFIANIDLQTKPEFTE
ncbi:endo alpha-1,4 polygalactosaminidase [Maribacter sp. HTCC2170]|uniref:endo alpha-1,4 polygalactosaminidase n=1 Tax=Maribacter sp. (strain HTCC2170 / KCCM 42371) TaxID=313603 RepID=UPI0013054330|nr:endo alpha-1,4 polygalactosaminidase [Maribacter sp. HTCC2170]